MAVKITFRPTSRQVLGRALFIADLAAVAAVAPAVVYMAVTGEWSLLTLFGLVVVAALVALAVAYAGSRRHGVVLDERGIHPLEKRLTSAPEFHERHRGAHTERFAPWTGIADIRAERRAGRTVPVVYLLDPAQKPWRLRAPYSGRGLAYDAALDEKIFVMRSLWEGYKRSLPPYREVS